MNAKGNALGRQLKAAGLDAETCTFEVIAIGPIFDEQDNLAAHHPLRDKAAALERALADELRERGYQVLGHHPRASMPDAYLFNELKAAIQHSFPSRRAPEAPRSRFKPIRLRGEGPSASEVLVKDRERF